MFLNGKKRIHNSSKKSSTKLIFLCSVGLLSNVYASNIQKFTGLSYDNPARLSQVKNKQFIIGGTGLFYNFTYSGSSPLGVGSANQQPNVYLPYFRFSDRINPEFVVSLDVTDPIASNIHYPTESFINPLIIYAVLNSTKIAPNISYNVTKDLALGVGVDALHVIWDWAQITAGNQFTNKSGGWNYGWHAGVLYTVSASTTLGLSYYSLIKVPFSGPSTYKNISTNWSTDINMPPTALFTVTQKMTPKWTLSGSYSYSWWNVNSLYYTNTARGNLISPNWNYHNTSRVAIGSQYNINDKWAYRIGLAYDESPIETPSRTISNSTADIFALAIGGTYNITPSVGIDLTYIRVLIKNAMIQLPSPSTKGQITGNANGVEAKLTWNF